MVLSFLMKRKAKVQTISYKPGTDHAGMNPVPYIRIANKMLADYGFKCGEKIVIEYQQGKITIFLLNKYQNIMTNSKIDFIDEELFCRKCGKSISRGEVELNDDEMCSTCYAERHQ